MSETTLVNGRDLAIPILYARLLFTRGCIHFQRDAAFVRACYKEMAIFDDLEILFLRHGEQKTGFKIRIV